MSDKKDQKTHVAGAAKAGKPPKARSPNYPAINLEKAIGRAAVLYQRNGRHAAAPETIATFWGYKPKSSDFKLTVAAVRAFGLLEPVSGGGDRSFKLTPLALDIVTDYPPGSPEHVRVTKEAALRPKLHSDLWGKYSVPLPSDDELRRYLVRDRGFYDKIVHDVIAEYKATLAFSNLTQGDTIYPADAAPNGRTQEPSMEKSFNPPTLPPVVPKPPASLDPVSLSEGAVCDTTNLDEGVVRLQWPGDLSAESVKEFEYWVEGLIRRARRKAGLKGK
jgi:hypothetical protein